MKISAVNVYKVNLPFLFKFAHARETVASAKNIVVEVLTDDEELAGYGEGAPRPLFTGETQEVAVRGVEYLCLSKAFPWDLQGVEQIWEFVNSAPLGRNYCSALCAMEMALLDLLAGMEGRNILYYLPTEHFTDEVRYGGTVPIGDEKTIGSLCQMMREFEIADVRLKMGKNFGQNRVSLEVARQQLGWDCSLRADVNCGWDLDIAKEHLPLLESHRVSVLEQPLMPDDPNWEVLSGILKIAGISLMADESVYLLEDLEKAISEHYYDIINIKLTKSPGFMRSLKMAEQVRTAGLDYQVGCQLGESGILSAAGRALCLVSSDALYYDGCYDRVMLGDNLTTEHVTFGHGGKAGPLEGSGFGITVNLENIKRFSGSFTTVHRSSLRSRQSVTN
jgi:muconate cycloisomerase